MSLVLIPIVVIIVGAAFASVIWLLDLRRLAAEDSFEREMRETCEGPVGHPGVYGDVPATDHLNEGALRGAR